MAHTPYKLVWLKNLLQELGIQHSQPMDLIYDNQATIYSASNPVFHEQKKHIVVNFLLMHQKFLQNVIQTHVKSIDQWANMFIKSWGGGGSEKGFKS